jgi:hypothetical protein
MAGGGAASCGAAENLAITANRHRAAFPAVELYCVYFRQSKAVNGALSQLALRIPMNPEFESESWEQTGPSYIQAYVTSAFILIGILSIASHQVPVTPLSLFFLSIWFGMFFYWLIQNRRAERTFASDRIIVANGQVEHTFRYAVTEAKHSAMAVSEIKHIKVHDGQPIAIELIGETDTDFFWLPNYDQVKRFEDTLLKLNPRIQVAK